MKTDTLEAKLNIALLVCTVLVLISITVNLAFRDQRSDYEQRRDFVQECITDEAFTIDQCIELAGSR